MATHSSILAWRIPWTEEPGGLQSLGLQGSDMTEQLILDGLCSVFWGTPYVPKNELLVLLTLDFQELMKKHLMPYDFGLLTFSASQFLCE